MKRGSRKRIKKLFFILICLLVSGVAIVGAKRGLERFLTSQSFSFSPTHSSRVFTPEVQSGSVSEFENALTRGGFTIRSLTVASDSSSITVELKDGPVVVFTRSKDIEWQVSSLQSIMRRLTIESNTPSQIDFRFTKPIVNF